MITFAIATQVSLLLYHQTTTLCDFFPFNGVRFYSRRETLLEAGFNFLMMSLPLAGFIWRVPILMKFGVEYYFVLFALECATWWAPYFFGAGPKWTEMHERVFSKTITIVPRRGKNPGPNLEHLILMVITVVASLATLAAFLSLRISFPWWWIGAVVGAVMVWGTVFQFCIQGREKTKI